MKKVWILNKVGRSLFMVLVYPPGLKVFLRLKKVEIDSQLLLNYLLDQTLSRILVWSRSGPTEKVEMRTPTNSPTRRT